MSQAVLSRRVLRLIAAIGAAACVLALLSIGLSAPEPVDNTELGPEWQCGRFAFVLTTCTRIEHFESASVRLRKEHASPRPRV